MTDTTQLAREKLLKDFNDVVADTEQLLKSVAAAGGEKAQGVRAEVEKRLEAAKQRLHEMEATALERTRAAAQATDEYVHAKPWQSIAIVAGIAAVIGIVLGLLLNRR